MGSTLAVYWYRWVAKRALRLVTLLLAVSVLSFLLVSLSPVDPVQAYVGADMMRVSPEQREMIAERWGLYDPWWERMIRWYRSLLRGDFGTSMIYRRPVLSVIGERFLSTLALMGLAWLISGILGFALGVLAGAREGSWLDRAIKAYGFILASTPVFWLALILLYVFGVWLKWLPLGMRVPAGVLAQEVSILDRIRHLVLPALTLSVLGVANVTLHTRQKTVDVMNSEYVLFARARGKSEWSIVRRHVLRNVALPAITIQFAQFSELFGGSVLAEQVFSYPGLGQATVQSGLRGDVPLLLGIVIFVTLFVFLGNTFADLLYGIVDPRIRLAGLAGKLEKGSSW